MQAKYDKIHGHTENSILSSICMLTPILILSGWMTSHCTTLMPNMIMVQELDSTRTNNLTHLVTQCAQVIPQSTHIKVLKLWH